VNAPVTSITLPLRFVVAGLLALVTGVAALVLRPELLSTYHYNQYVIATTHLFVLGWLCSIVMGAMYQLVPVALETRLYSERLAAWQFVFHVVGFTGMVWMFWTWNLKQVGHFGSILAVGVVLFVYNLVRTLARVPRWNVVASGVASALAWLSLTVLAGLAIAAGKCSYESTGVPGPGSAAGPLLRGLRSVAGFVAHFDALNAMHAHAHLGVVGIFLMMIVGVSYKLVPMFTLSEVQSPRRAALSVLLLNGGLAGSFFAILVHSRFKFLCALVIVAGLVLYGIEIIAIVRARKRRTLDWGLKYFLTAMALLGPLSGLGLVLAWPGLPLTALTGQLENAYGFLALLGVVSFAIIGMLYKIVPFLAWYAAYSKRIGLGPVPSLAELYSSSVQIAGYWTYVAGLGVTTVGIILGSANGVHYGCVLLALSLLVFMVNIVKILSHLVRPVTAPAKSAVKPVILHTPSKYEC
jgi:Cytochrome C and Quinol oxidase polypeptide I